MFYANMNKSTIKQQELTYINSHEYVCVYKALHNKGIFLSTVCQKNCAYVVQK